MMVSNDNEPFLQILHSPLLNKFLHCCVDNLIGKESTFDNYCSEVEWKIEDFNRAKILAQKLLKECAIHEDESRLQKLDDNLRDAFSTCFRIRKNEIFQYLMKQAYLDCGKNLVENIDWKVKWILGTSKLADFKEAVVQFDLHCIKKDLSSRDVTTDTINFEMNLAQVDKLTQALEKMNEAQ